MRLRETYRCHAPAGARPWVIRMTILSTLLAASAGHAALFDAPAPYGVDGPSVRVVTTDLDAANGPDLVAGSEAGEEGPSLSILRNDGTGRFGAATRLVVDPDRFLLHDIAASDFDGSGRGDVAVAADDLSLFPTRTVVLVYLNDGSGGFRAPAEYELAGLFPDCIEAADATNDAVLDILVCHSDPDKGAGRVTLLPGVKKGDNATGQFGTPSNIAVGTSPANVRVVDLDGDGAADLLVGDSAQGQVFVLYGTGGGQFGPPTPLADVPAPSAIRTRPGAAATRPDVLISSVLDTGVAVLVQTGPRRFAPPTRLPTDQPASDMAAADVNGDGVTDLALPAPTGGTLAVWLGIADGTLEPIDAVSVDEGANSIAAADFNGDGRADLATASLVTDRIVVATSRAGTPIPAGPGDANCDGRIDRSDLDALLARLFAAGCAGADANDDGAVSAADLPRMIKVPSQAK